MSLLFMDSFDHYNTTADIVKKWSTSSVGVAPATTFGRNGTNGLRLPSPQVIGKAFPTGHSTLIVGAAMSARTWTTGTSNAILFYDAGTIQAVLTIDSTGLFKFWRGNQAALLATAGNLISLTAYNYVELKVTFNNTTGSYELRVNGVTYLSGTGQDTCATANNSANEVDFWGNGGQEWWMDDVYMANNQGTVNNNFLGDVRVIALMPNAAGNYTGFAATGAATNWQAVSEIPQDGDTSYVAADVAGTRDSYNYANLPAGATSVLGVQRMGVVRKDDAGTRTMRPFSRIGGVDYDSASVATLGAAYAGILEVLDNSPATSSPWTVAEVNAAEHGVKVEA